MSVANPLTSRGGCGGIGRRAALRSLWVNNPWKFESSQPHHSLFQIPRKPGSFAVNLVGGDTNWVTNVKNKRALFAQETGHILPL